MDTEDRRRVCRLIAGLVVVDDVLDDTENAFVDAMLVRFGLGAEERDALFPIVDADEAVKELTALPPGLRNEAFGLLVSAAAADRRFMAEERDYLHKVGAVLGLEGAAIDTMVAQAMGLSP